MIFLSDEILVWLFLDGNKDAFSEIVKRYKAQIYNLTSFISNDREEDERLLQEMLYRLYFMLGLYNFEGPLFPWMYETIVSIYCTSKMKMFQNAVTNECYTSLTQRPSVQIMRQKKSVETWRRICNFKILQPLMIGTMQLRNRFVMPAMVTNLASADGAVTQQFKAFHAARAKGGVGLIILEATYVQSGGKAFQCELGIDDDTLISGLKELTDTVHAYGAKIAVQLNHAGRQTNSALTGAPVVAPSPVPCPIKREIPRELTRKEIRELVEAYGEAARRARDAGFDAVEIHGAHGYLINQFLSPYSNKRTDEYGGTARNRMKFPLEVVAHVRAKVGNDFPVIYRISAEEYVAGGLTIEETKVFSRILAEAGVDAIHVSGGVYESATMIVQPMAIKQGCFIDNASEIKKEVRGQIPVIVTGRIKDPLMAERILQEENADLISMGRAVLADPELPNKVLEGRFSAIRRCIGCNQGCIDRIFKDQNIQCLANATAGSEVELEMTATERKAKTVMIIGGGPGGMEAARVAAVRGHQVFLYEENDKLGGNLLTAAVPPHKQDLNDLTNWLIHQIHSLGVTVTTGKAASLSEIERIQPDCIIFATGAIPIIPDIPGLKSKNAITAHDLLNERASVGLKVAVIGGGLVGCETAEYLSERGKQVTIFEMLNEVAADAGQSSRSLMLKRLAINRVEIFTRTKVREISEAGIIIEKNGKLANVGEFDSIVLAVGLKPDHHLAAILEQRGVTYFTIGDCVKPRNILDAIHEGYRVAYKL